ncbi:murein transglycosylase A [Sulfurimonas sp.]|nr:murein transglycosylase A [Sulfurimonas sp.]
MKNNLIILILALLFVGCSKSAIPKVEPSLEVPTTPKEIEVIDVNISKEKVSENYVKFSSMPKTQLIKSSFNELPDWENEDYKKAINSFINSCKSSKTKKIYKKLCQRAERINDPKGFLKEEFIPYKIKKTKKESGLLTGYYEPKLNASKTKKGKFIYPIYETPKDMFVVDLGSQYPELKNYRLRGRVENNKLIPYYDRKDANKKPLNADIICYTDSKIDLFFLEVQGSGRVTFDDGETMYIGYDNQNGHKYKSIGKYLVKIGAIRMKDVSLQSIRAWFKKNPKRIDEVLNYNKSMVFFKEKEQAATGSLGLELTPERSIAVDNRYIPLGSMLYLSADMKDNCVNKVVIAQDTGGAIKGSVRADMFLGFGERARAIAGKLKAPLKLWILLPKGGI